LRSDVPSRKLPQKNSLASLIDEGMARVRSSAANANIDLFLLCDERRDFSLPLATVLPTDDNPQAHIVFSILISDTTLFTFAGFLPGRVAPDSGGEAFSARTSSIRVRGKSASEGHAELQADTGSFDSENGLASEPTLSAQDDRVVLTQDDRVDVKAQDDRVGVMGDLELFRAFVAGKRLAESHIHYEQQPEYPLRNLPLGFRWEGDAPEVVQAGGVALDELDSVGAEFFDRADLCYHPRVRLGATHVANDHG
jgi:hypothetical protein